MLSSIRRTPFWVQIIAGLVFGIAFGFIARAAGVHWLDATLSKIGDLFVGLLMLAVPPLVFTAIVTSVANLRNVTNAARLAARTLLWFMITSLIAVVIGMVIGLVTHPGSGGGFTSTGEKASHQGSWADFITGIIPTNIVQSFSEVNVLQIVFLAIVVGIAAVKTGPKAEPFLKLNESVLAIVQKALWWVIRLAPIGTMGLIGRSVSQYGWDLLKPMATFTADVYVGCALVLFGVYPLLLKVFAKVSPVQFFRGVWPATQLAFVSRSSVGTMPLTQRVTERMGVPKEYTSFAVPFGATTKMDGCAAIYPAIAAIFVAEAFHVHLDIKDYLLIAFVSVIGSAATAGLTGAIVMLTLTLSTLGLPLAGVGLLLAIDPILDMMRTATNVTGQSVIPILVAAKEKILDREQFAKAHTLPLWEEEAPAAAPAEAKQEESALARSSA